MPRTTRPSPTALLAQTRAELAATEKRLADAEHTIQGQRNLIEQQSSLIDERAMPYTKARQWLTDEEVENSQTVITNASNERPMMATRQDSDAPLPEGIVATVEELAKAVSSLDITLDRVISRLDPVVSPVELSPPGRVGSASSREPSSHRNALMQQIDRMRWLEDRMLLLLERLDV